MRHRPIGEQVVVITGASSGIGRATALRFAEEGACVVLAARNETTLGEVAREVERLGGTAHVVVTDVADHAQIERLADAAVRRFGRIDTWVNDAAVTAFAPIEELEPEAVDRMLRVNLGGQIHGTRVALRHMRAQGHGGIVNVSSAVGARAIPLQSVYVATKFGIRGFTESVRLELQEAGERRVTLSLVLPPSTNTPLFEHARARLGGASPRPLPPVYEPEVVADAVAFVARHPRRELYVGGWGKALQVGERVGPGVLDRYMVRNGRMFRRQIAERPDPRRDNLFAPMPRASTHGSFGERSKSTSLYTRVFEYHPVAKLLLALVALLGVGLTARRAGG